MNAKFWICLVKLTSISLNPPFEHGKALSPRICRHWNVTMHIEREFMHAFHAINEKGTYAASSALGSGWTVSISSAAFLENHKQLLLVRSTELILENWGKSSIWQRRIIQWTSRAQQIIQCFGQPKTVCSFSRFTVHNWTSTKVAFTSLRIFAAVLMMEIRKWNGCDSDRFYLQCEYIWPWCLIYNRSLAKFSSRTFWDPLLAWFGHIAWRN